MFDLGLTHLALPVRDGDAAIAFYGAYAHMHVIQRRGDETTGLDVAWLSDRTRPFSEGRLARAPEDRGLPAGYCALLADADGHTLELSYGQEIGITLAGPPPGSAANPVPLTTPSPVPVPIPAM